MHELFSTPDLTDFPQSMHLAMVRDSVRVPAYVEAIGQAVSPGDIVLDVGSGTGVLSILAAKAGAAKVYSVENSSMAEYSKQVVAQNGLSDVIEVLPHNIFSDALPAISADVVISEFFGTFGIGENVIRIMDHVRNHYMKPDGVMVPGNMDLWIAPVQCTYDYHQVTNWDRKIADIDFASVQPLAYNAVYHVVENEIQLLAEPVMIKSIDFMNPGAMDLFADAVFEITEEGVLHGMAGWFSSTLSATVTIDTGPHQTPTHWGQILFPTGRPNHVQPGDAITFGFEETNSKKESTWQWRGEVTDGASQTVVQPFAFQATRGFK